MNEDAAFRAWARPILISMQQSYSMDIISRRMRSGMEIDNKRPKTVKKKFDYRTGEVYEGGHSIEKDIWSMAMEVTSRK